MKIYNEKLNFEKKYYIFFLKRLALIIMLHQIVCTNFSDLHNHQKTLHFIFLLKKKSLKSLD